MRWPALIALVTRRQNNTVRRLAMQTPTHSHIQTPAHPRPWVRPLWQMAKWGVIGLGTAVALLVLWLKIWHPITVLPRVRLVPGFLLTTSAGERITSEDLRGGLVLYTFSHTDCTAATCPHTTAQLADLHTWLTANIPPEVPLTLVTITVNPEQDTAAQLADHLAPYPTTSHIPWLYLTGTAAPHPYILQGFKLQLLEETAELEFNPRLVLADEYGMVRAEYRTMTPNLEIIGRDVDLLYAEYRNTDWLMRWGFETARFLACYP